MITSIIINAEVIFHIHFGICLEWVSIMGMEEWDYGKDKSIWEWWINWEYFLHTTYHYAAEILLLN